MKTLVCSIYDGAVGAYQMPFYARSKAEASRIFSDAVADQNSPFAKHPSDFSLFAIGTFSDADAVIEQTPAPVKIITALECLAQPDNVTTN